MVALFSQYMATADVLAQVLASIYIAVAIFSGEQVSTAFKSQQPQIRINPRRYISYLNLWRACGLLIILPVAGRLYSVDLFPAIHAPALKSSIAAGLQTIVVAAILWTIYDTLVHRSIERTFKKITGSVSRLTAWALQEEREENERLKLITSLLERTNDVDLERLLLARMDESLKQIVKAPSKHQGVDIISVLRALRNNIDKRPLEDTDYYRQLFDFVHYRWAEASAARTALHRQNFFQISSTLGSLAKHIQQRSLGQGELGYDFFVHLRTFLQNRPETQALYFRHIGNNLLLHMITSPQDDFIWEDPDYAAGWRVDYQRPLEEQSYTTRMLFKQYLSLVRKSQREYNQDEPNSAADAATHRLFPDVDPSNWADLVTLWHAYRTVRDPEEGLRYWLEHPPRFASISFLPINDYSYTGSLAESLKEMNKDFKNRSMHAVQLAANTELFAPSEIKALLKIAKKWLRNLPDMQAKYAREKLQDIVPLLEGLAKRTGQ